MDLNENSDKKIDKTFGQVFHDLRSWKNFSKTEADAEVMTDTALTNFENGKSIPSFDKVYKMLKNINVTLLEYDDAYNRNKLKQDILLYGTTISEALLTKNVEKLKFILSEIEHEIKRSPNVKKYEIDKWRIEATIKELDTNYVMPSSDISSLKDYLMHLSEWGLYDIHLFGHCVNVFINDDDFGDLVTQMLSHTEDTGQLHNVEHAVIVTTLNIIDSCLSRGNFKLAEAFINHLNRLKIHDYYMFEKFTLKYATANLEYQKGKDSALEVMKKCYEIALFCGCTSLADTISKEIPKIQEMVKNAKTHKSENQQ
ncbi:hypothetical protein OfM1_09240 [Lactovum odontotermitis]